MGAKKPEYPSYIFHNRNCRCWYFIVLFITLLAFVTAFRHYYISLFGTQDPTSLVQGPPEIALGKTIFLAAVWMNVTTLLPILIAGHTWQPDFTLFILSRFFLIYAICILFDYRDRADDKAAGIRSLITYLSEKGITYVFCFSLLVFALSTAGLCYYDYPVFAIALLFIPGIITAALYNYARKNFSDMFYYFILDGLMALSSLLLFIPGI